MNKQMQRKTQMMLNKMHHQNAWACNVHGERKMRMVDFHFLTSEQNHQKKQIELKHSFHFFQTLQI